MLPASNLFHFHIVLEVCCRNVGTATRIKEHPLLWGLRYFHSKDFTSGGQFIVIRDVDLMPPGPLFFRE